jgi:hypothetical protein
VQWCKIRHTALSDTQGIQEHSGMLAGLSPGRARA